MTAPNPQAGFTRGITELHGRKAAGLDNDSSTTRRYFITGAEDEEDAIYLLGVGAPTELGNLVPSQPDIEEINAYTGSYFATLKYVPPDSPEAQQERQGNWPAPKLLPLKIGDPVRWSWRGQTNQIQIAATDPSRVTPYPAADATYRNFNGAINVDPETRQVGGTGRYFAMKDYTAELVMAKSAVNNAFITSLDALETTTNLNPFSVRMFSSENAITFSARSVLYLTSQADEEEDGIRMRFSFLMGYNEENLSVGGIDSIFRYAHDYLWPLWKTEKDTSTDYLVRKAERVYVHQLYEAKAWTPLEALLS